jgi:hypothetical protein
VFTPILQTAPANRDSIPKIRNRWRWPAIFPNHGKVEVAIAEYPLSATTKRCKLDIRFNLCPAYGAAPKPVSDEELELMALIDRCHLKHPFYGSRRIHDWLEDQGHRVNRKNVRQACANSREVFDVRWNALSGPFLLPTQINLPMLRDAISQIQVD